MTALSEIISVTIVKIVSAKCSDTGSKVVKTDALFILGAFAEFRKSTYKCRQVRPSAWNNSAPTGRILMKLDI